MKTFQTTKADSKQEKNPNKKVVYNKTKEDLELQAKQILQALIKEGIFKGRPFLFSLFKK